MNLKKEITIMLIAPQGVNTMNTSFCVICGVDIKYRKSGGRGANYPLCTNHECLETYLNFQQVASAPLIDKKVDRSAYLKQRNSERYDGFCGRCGKPIKLDFRHNYLRHGMQSSCEAAPTSRDQLKKEPRRNRIAWQSRLKFKTPPRVHLKPWKNPDSLFCDTEFLETEILRKKIRKGKECTD